MYQKMRTVHLVAGVLALPFLLMYSVSSVQMAHPKWFVAPPSVSQATATLAPGMSDARAVAQALMERGEVRGEINGAVDKGDVLETRVVRPGTVHSIIYTKATGAASVRTDRSKFIFVLNRLHHLHGLDHEFGPVNLWGLALGLTAAILIVLGASGLYLWFKTYKERRIGAVLLAANLAFAAIIIALVRSA